MSNKCIDDGGTCGLGGYCKQCPMVAALGSTLLSDVMDIISWEATPDTRLYTPNKEYVAPKIQRRFFCTSRDGTTGYIWADVYETNSFLRIIGGDDHG